MTDGYTKNNIVDLREWNEMYIGIKQFKVYKLSLTHWKRNRITFGKQVKLQKVKKDGREVTA